MKLTIVDEPVPLEADADGIVRVKGTGITLDTVVIAFAQGATAEEIRQQYPTLALADVYAVIAYYLRHRDAVDTYLHARQQDAAHVRGENERRFDPQGLRERLLARNPRVLLPILKSAKA